MTSGNGNHNDKCAKAVGHVCRCGGCGGSMHGWKSWVGLVAQADERQNRRQQIDALWGKNYNSSRQRSNAKNRAACTDAARLDIADWLAQQGANGGFEAGITAGAGGQPNLGGTSEPHGYLPVPPVDGAGSEGYSGPQAQSGPPEANELGGKPNCPAVIEQVKILADAMTESIWDEIAAGLGGSPTQAAQIKRQLAHHGWCDLFIGLVQVVQASRTALEEIPKRAKRRVKKAIRNSSMQGKRSEVSSAVVDVVVDKVWSAFKGAMVAQMPLLSVVTREDAVRTLRILAVFICPAPEDHKEVLEYALKPLADDAKKIITEETKARLVKVIDEWKAAA